MNLLLTTLGMSWAIVPELLGFSNPQQLDLYAHHQETEKIASDRKSYDIQPVNEIWIVTTGGSQVGQNIATLQSWHQALGLMPPLRIFQAEDTDHLSSLQECRWMTELILRAVLQAQARVGEGQVLLSLTGGLKTMSADMQHGLKVTVNTDNPGISRTDFTQELHRAARLTPGGLSAWEILQLVRNSFRAAFVSHRISKELILNAEAEILEIFKKTRLAI